MAKIDTRCLECSHEFPTEILILTEEGWGCPKCHSVLIERIFTETFSYDEAKVKYKEGGGHD
jgi:Zn finger protein HypA/HybF involved in hydrogenase expression